MVVVSQASKLSLPNPCLPSSPPNTISVMYEPNSLSLALMHSDSSLSLYPSLPLLSLTSLPLAPQILVPPPSTSSTFVILKSNSNSNSNPRVLFIVVGPHNSGAQILLRFYLLQKSKNVYAQAQVSCSQKGLHFDPNLGILLDVNHGASVKLVGSVNYFAMYSFSRSKIWVFCVKSMDDNDDDGGGGGSRVKLMRCAVIECCKPIWSMSLSFGFLIFGEENGVRVLNLRSLVKGKMKSVKTFDLNGKYETKTSGLPNGIIGDDVLNRSSKDISCNGYLDGKIDKHSVSFKQKSIKYRQDSSEGGACFVALKSANSSKMPMMSLKAISVQAVSSKRFLILDSAGDLHILHLSGTVAGANITCHIKQLPHIMNVQKLAVLPDVSSRMQTIWIADGYHSVHMLTASEMDAAANENARNELEEKLMDISVAEAIFTGEKIQDVVPFATNGILILGQGNLYAYANS